MADDAGIDKVTQIDSSVAAGTGLYPGSGVVRVSGDVQERIRQRRGPILPGSEPALATSRSRVGGISIVGSVDLFLMRFISHRGLSRCEAIPFSCLARKHNSVATLAILSGLSRASLAFGDLHSDQLLLDDKGAHGLNPGSGDGLR